MNISNVFKNERLKKNITVYNIFNLILILLIFFLDRFSKIKIIKSQSNLNNLFINDYLNFDLVWNTGIGFGLFNLEANLFYHIVSLLIFFVILVLLYFAFRGNEYEKFLYSMIIGGALGNLYDRITYFAVPDFIDFHIDNYHWFTFNIADIFISLGVILLLFKEISYKKK
jgi:signal peptidase II